MSTQTPIAVDKRLYLDTTPSATATYARIGDGVTSVTPSLNPTIKSVQYINMAASKNTKTAVARQYGIGGERVVGDAAMDFMIDLADKVGGDCETTLVSYNTWDTPVAEAYPAKRYDVMISISNDGTLTGGDTQAIEATMYVNSEATEGTFNPTTLEFVEA
jgi:hypothetical protein